MTDYIKQALLNDLRTYVSTPAVSDIYFEVEKSIGVKIQIQLAIEFSD